MMESIYLKPINNFIHLKGQNEDLAVSLDKITYAQRLEGVLFIFFSNAEPLRIPRALADEFWDILMENSITTIYYPEDENAETPDI